MLVTGAAWILLAGAANANGPVLLYSEIGRMLRQSLAGGDPTLLTDNVGSNFLTSPDQTTVVYQSLYYNPNAAVPPEVFSQRIDGTQDPILLSSEGVPAYLGAVSPDGQTVVFVQNDGLSQVYARNIDGSGPLRLLSSAVPEGDAYFDEKTVFTPDSSRIVFHERGGDGLLRLYSRLVDGSEDEPILLSNTGPLFRSLSTEGWSRALSPNSTRVAYRIREGAIVGLWSRALDGSDDPRRLSSAIPTGDVWPGLFYGPDSDFVVFLEDTGGYEQLFTRRDADGWAPTLLSTDTPSASAGLPFGSPVASGTNWVVYTDELDDTRQLYMKPIDGTAEEPILLSPGSPTNVKYDRSASEHVISPDGQQVIYRAGLADGPTGVFVSAIDPENPQPVLISGQNHDMPLLHLASDLFSPDGLRAAFLNFDEARDVYNLHVAATDGSGLPVLVSNAYPEPGTDPDELGYRVQWSPDSETIFFTQELDFSDADSLLWGSPTDGSTMPVQYSDWSVQSFQVVPEPSAPLAVLATVFALAGTRHRAKRRA